MNLNFETIITGATASIIGALAAFFGLKQQAKDIEGRVGKLESEQKGLVSDKLCSLKHDDLEKLIGESQRRIEEKVDRVYNLLAQRDKGV